MRYSSRLPLAKEGVRIENPERHRSAGYPEAFRAGQSGRRATAQNMK